LVTKDIIDDTYSFRYMTSNVYRQGTKNGKPDSLSRRLDYMKNNEDIKPENILDIKNVKEVPCFIEIMSDLLEKIIDTIIEDATAEDIRLYFSENNVKNDYIYKLFRKMERFKIKDNIIFYKNLIYIPESLRLEILEKYHEKSTSGYFVIRRTLELIIRNLWWPKIQEDVKSYINSCECCARNKVNRHRKYGLLQPLDTPELYLGSLSKLISSMVFLILKDTPLLWWLSIVSLR